jgi:hypothetical protein
MRLCYPDPTNHVHDPANPGVGPGSVPTDAYYADLSFSDADSWDLDGDGFHGEYEEDSPDFLAEVNVGRIPTSVSVRITYTLDKLVRVEQDSGAWKRNALHAGAILFYENEDFTGIPLRDGATVVNEIESHFMQAWTTSRYSEQSGLVPSSYPWPALTYEAFVNDWSSGTYGFVNWGGHGWPDRVSRTESRRRTVRTASTAWSSSPIRSPYRTTTPRSSARSPATWATRSQTATATWESTS